MPNENSQRELSEKKKRAIAVRDLKPKVDPSGGEKEDKPPSGRIGEADFMEGLR